MAAPTLSNQEPDVHRIRRSINSANGSGSERRTKRKGKVKTFPKNKKRGRAVEPPAGRHRPLFVVRHKEFRLTRPGLLMEDAKARSKNEARVSEGYFARSKPILERQGGNEKAEPVMQGAVFMRFVRV